MVSTVWSVSCLLFYSVPPVPSDYVKVGARPPFLLCLMESSPLSADVDASPATGKPCKVICIQIRSIC